MITYNVLLVNNGFEVNRIIKASNLKEAYVKMKLASAKDTNWSAHPIWQGEKQVDTEFEHGGYRVKVTIINPKFFQ